jgi:hypothetical protein
MKYRKYLPIISITLLLGLSFDSYGQSEVETDTLKHDHQHDHAQEKHELGLSISPAYFIKENVFTFAMHLHYIFNIPNSRFGVGASFERIFLDPKHITASIVGAYRPIGGLSILLSPGVTFEDGDNTPFFALHLETAYEFHIGKFHLGPALEFAYDPNDYHIGVGLHTGYAF